MSRKRPLRTSHPLGPSYATHQAYWDPDVARYLVPELHWGSADGASWENEEAGDPAGGAEFAGARILLVGGPLDGAILA